LRYLAVILVSALTGSNSFADNVKKAVSHYEAATAAYAVGDYTEAAQEYQVAYKLKPDAALLYDAAQCYRLGGSHDKALLLYKSFIKLYPEHPSVEVVRSYIASLTEPPAPTDPPAATEKDDPAPDAYLKGEIALDNAPTPAPVMLTPMPSPPPVHRREHVPVYKQWWLWTIVGTVVVGGVIAAAVLATPQTTTTGPFVPNAPDVGPGRSALTVRW
jgi:tetratricopeptide (TPR) repeat protein